MHEVKGLKVHFTSPLRSPAVFQSALARTGCRYRTSAFIVSNFLLLLGALVDSLSQLTQSSVALIVAIGTQSPYTALDYEI